MEKQDYLVSVIVPVYNVGNYLTKCLDSIVNQTYTKLEIILVDDGSTDNSPSICDKYAIQDSRIKVIHKMNGGLSDARNCGLDNMIGDFILFVDSDDYLEQDAIAVLIETAVQYNTQITCMKSCIVSPEYKIVNNQSNGTGTVQILTSENYIKGMCEKRKSESVCDKLFDAILFKNRRFEKGRLNEDFFLLSKMLFDDLQIAEIDYTGYNYYQRPGSITNSGYGKSLVDSVKNAYELKKLAEIEASRLEKYFARLTLYQARTLFIVIPWEHVRNNEDDYVDSLYYLRKCIASVKNVKLSKLDKLIILSIAKMPKISIWLVGRLWRIKKNNIFKS